jgi:hypothetical protein
MAHPVPKSNDTPVGGVSGTHKIGIRHFLFVEIPPRDQRAEKWARAHGIEEVDMTRFATMIRCERLNCG